MEIIAQWLDDLDDLAYSLRLLGERFRSLCIALAFLVTAAGTANCRGPAGSEASTACIRLRNHSAGHANVSLGDRSTSRNATNHLIAALPLK